MSTKKEIAATAVAEKETPETAKKVAAAEPKTAPEAAATGPKITVDDAKVMACYANFCRVSSTPEELILDLGLNPQPMSRNDVTVQVSQRIILNHYTAKRMLSALSMALQRHEQAFGVLETDIRRRVVQQ